MANRLAGALSPYLLQHANNPVDWWEWGDEAFAEAKRLDKPVFLSIGYATCHWCHVMAHESFEDEEVAGLMNEHFVAIKLDREERPDVDQLYMTFCQAVSGRGGWPLTVFLTPDRKPFYVGTYFPKSGGGNRPGMMELLPAISRAWSEGRDQIESSADDLLVAIGQATGGQTSEREPSVDDAFNSLAAQFDAQFGGFGGAPKFPTPHNHLFLLREHARTHDALPLQIVRETLRAMRLGGIWDHVGGGFHRYSTDERWKLPHFEKMLYDQALLTLAYTEAWQAFREPLFAQTARDTIAYVLRELSDERGGFYSAEDADSRNADGEMEEGAFYVWTWDEIDRELPRSEVPLALALFNAEREGNFEDEATRERTGSNVMYLNAPVDVSAKRLEMEPDELEGRVERILKRLFDVRATRERPLLDDKILTDWNGLMIAALSRAAWAFEDAHLLGRAKDAAEFVLSVMRTPEGRLVHRYREGEAGLDGLADDYAFMAWGLLELYQASAEPRWLRASIDLVETLHAHFWDEEHGGYFLAPDDGEPLLVRQKVYYDGATPSANSVAAYTLVRLAHLTARTEFRDRARTILQSSSDIAAHPSGHTMAMMAGQILEGSMQEVVVVGDDDRASALARLVRSHYLPFAVWHIIEGPNDDLEAMAPYISEMGRDGSAAYVCRDFTCDAPVSDREALENLLLG